MSLFSMDVSELFTVSKFAAVLAITADCACVWATPDVTPFSVWSDDDSPPRTDADASMPDNRSIDRRR
jgi:hypothetical protein